MEVIMKKLLVALLITVSVVNITKTSYEYSIEDVRKLAQLSKSFYEYEKEQLEGRIASAPCRKITAYTALTGALLMSAASLIPGVGLFAGFPCLQMCSVAGLLTYGEHAIETCNKARYEQVKKNIARLEQYINLSAEELQKLADDELKKLMSEMSRNTIL
jgi:hypothetical protein